MITPAQREVLRGIEALLELSPPDMRVGQLVAWLGDLAGDDLGKRCLADVEDDEMLTVIASFRRDLESRLTDVAESA
jgi:hypothetical protein